MTFQARRWFLSLFSLGVATLTAVSGTQAQQPATSAAKAPETKELTLITTSDVQIGGPWFVARDKGFFTEEGFTKVDVQAVSAIPTIYPRFVTGDIQVYSSAEPPTLTLSGGGVPVKVVAIYSDMTGLHGVLAGPQIKTARDLEGKKVALQKGTVMELLFQNFCRAYGCDVSKVQVISMPAPESAAALVDGSVDAVVSWQPFLGQALDAGKDKGLHYLFYDKTSFMPGTDGEHKKLHIAWAILDVAPAFLSKNPRTVDALLRVLDKSVNFIKSNPDEAAKIVAAELKLPQATARDYMNAVKYGLGIDGERVREIQTLADDLSQNKLIKNPVNFAVNILDPAPLKRVEPQLVTYP
jgi:ABC-type nitrate/sulfonate/bicarbonate transport system substrate-binding protein